jgi:hypothetical protein
LQTLKPNEDEKAEKAKNIFYNCFSESHFTSISGLGSSVLSKIVKIPILATQRGVFHPSIVFLEPGFILHS